MQPRLTWQVGLLLIAGLVSVGASVPASAQGYAGFYGGVYQPEENSLGRIGTFGLRGGSRLHPEFGIEGSLTRVDLGDAIPLDFDDGGFDFGVDLKFDLYNLDLSLQWFPRGGHFVVFAGPGATRVDARVRVSFLGETVSESDTQNILTAHAGLGYQWEVGDRFFIRTEARVRRYFDDDDDDSDTEGLAVSYKSTDYEGGVMLGWRF